MFLEFDEFKLEVLREQAYKLDLSLDAYISLMLDDMVSLNPIGKQTEPEKIMKKYIDEKWKNRIPEEEDIYRFMDEYEHLFRDALEDYKEENPDGNMEDCTKYVILRWGEYIYEEMEFSCDEYIKKSVELICNGNY